MSVVIRIGDLASLLFLAVGGKKEDRNFKSHYHSENGQWKQRGICGIVDGMIFKMAITLALYMFINLCDDSGS